MSVRSAFGFLFICFTNHFSVIEKDSDEDDGEHDQIGDQNGHKLQHSSRPTALPPAERTSRPQDRIPVPPRSSLTNSRIQRHRPLARSRSSLEPRVAHSRALPRTSSQSQQARRPQTSRQSQPPQPRQFPERDHLQGADSNQRQTTSPRTRGGNRSEPFVDGEVSDCAMIAVASLHLLSGRYGP